MSRPVLTTYTARSARSTLDAMLARRGAPRASEIARSRRGRTPVTWLAVSERSSVVVRYDSKTARVVDFTMQPESRTLPLLFSILPRARARSRSCVTLHPPSPRRGDPRADQLDDVRALERARPPAERADPLEAGAARAGAVVEHDARDAGRAQLVPGLAAEGRAVRRAGRVADRAAVSHLCL